MEALSNIQALFKALFGARAPKLLIFPLRIAEEGIAAASAPVPSSHPIATPRVPQYSCEAPRYLETPLLHTV